MTPSWPQQVDSCADSSTDSPQLVQAAITDKSRLIYQAQTSEQTPVLLLVKNASTSDPRRS